MSLRIECACGASYPVAASAAGNVFNCPKCGATLTAPDPNRVEIETDAGAEVLEVIGDDHDPKDANAPSPATVKRGPSRSSIAIAAAFVPIGLVLTWLQPMFGMSSSIVDYTMRWGPLLATVLLIGWNLINSVRKVALTGDAMSAAPFTLAQVALFFVLFIQLATHVGADNYRFASRPRLWHWAGFMLTHAVRAADIADSAEAYGFYLNPIHVRSHLASATLVAYRTILNVFFVSIIVSWVGKALKSLRREGNEVTRKMVEWASYGGLGLFVIAWAATAFWIRPWKAIDFLLWPLDSILHVLDIPDVLAVYNVRLHGLPNRFWENTLAAILRFVIAFGLADFLAYIAGTVSVMWFRCAGLNREQLEEVVKTHPNPKIKRLAVQRLGVIDQAQKQLDEEAANRRFLPNDTAPFAVIGVVVAVVIALVGFFLRPSQASLAEAVIGDDSGRAARATAVLHRMGPLAEEAGREVASQVGSLSNDRVNKLIDMFSSFGGPGAETLTTLVSAEHPERNSRIASALARIGPEAVDGLAKLVDVGDKELQPALYESLAKYRDAGMDALVWNLDADNARHRLPHIVKLDPYWQVHAGNELYLALTKTPEAVKALTVDAELSVANAQLALRTAASRTQAVQAVTKILLDMHESGEKDDEWLADVVYWIPKEGWQSAERFEDVFLTCEHPMLQKALCDSIAHLESVPAAWNKRLSELAMSDKRFVQESVAGALALAPLDDDCLRGLEHLLLANSRDAKEKALKALQTHQKSLSDAPYLALSALQSDVNFLAPRGETLRKELMDIYADLAETNPEVFATGLQLMKLRLQDKLPFCVTEKANGGPGLLQTKMILTGVAKDNLVDTWSKAIDSLLEPIVQKHNINTNALVMPFGSLPPKMLQADAVIQQYKDHVPAALEEMFAVLPDVNERTASAFGNALERLDPNWRQARASQIEAALKEMAPNVFVDRDLIDLPAKGRTETQVGLLANELKRSRQYDKACAMLDPNYVRRPFLAPLAAKHKLDLICQLRTNKQSDLASRLLATLPTDMTLAAEIGYQVIHPESSLSSWVGVQNYAQQLPRSPEMMHAMMSSIYEDLNLYAAAKSVGGRRPNIAQQRMNRAWEVLRGDLSHIGPFLIDPNFIPPIFDEVIDKTETTDGAQLATQVVPFLIAAEACAEEKQKQDIAERLDSIAPDWRQKQTPTYVMNVLAVAVKEPLVSRIALEYFLDAGDAAKPYVRSFAPCLTYPHDNVRELAVEALNKLYPDWITSPLAARTIRAIATEVVEKNKRTKRFETGRYYRVLRMLNPAAKDAAADVMMLLVVDEPELRRWTTGRLDEIGDELPNLPGTLESVRRLFQDVRKPTRREKMDAIQKVLDHWPIEDVIQKKTTEQSETPKSAT